MNVRNYFFFVDIVEVHHYEIEGEGCANSSRLVLTVRLSSVTENLRGRHHTISGYDKLLLHCVSSCQLLV